MEHRRSSPGPQPLLCCLPGSRPALHRALLDTPPNPAATVCLPPLHLECEPPEDIEQFLPSPGGPHLATDRHSPPAGCCRWWSKRTASRDVSPGPHTATRRYAASLVRTLRTCAEPVPLPYGDRPS